MPSIPEIVLEDGLDLGKLVTTGSILRINEDYSDVTEETEKEDSKDVDFIGKPLNSFEDLAKSLVSVDKDGWVKKKILEEGGGVDLDDGCTVSIVYSGYWEKEPEPFDVRPIYKPLVVDLKDNGLMPGLLIAVKSMLVGEVAVFLLSYQLMYGDIGVPPRIKPKANCVFYIKLVRSILTPKEGELNFSEPNIFERVHSKVKELFRSGLTMQKSNNTTAAIQLFRKAVFMLHKVRLANEEEEKIQEKLLIKLYTNLSICYNKTKQPLKACTACNEVNRLQKIWNNPKLLMQKAKALKMISEFKAAEKYLNQCLKLLPDSGDIKAELELLKKVQASCDQSKLLVQQLSEAPQKLVSPEFKNEVENLIKNFKENVDLCKLTLPAGLHHAEVEYVKEVCLRENVFCNKIKTDIALQKDTSIGDIDNFFV